MKRLAAFLISLLVICPFLAQPGQGGQPAAPCGGVWLRENAGNVTLKLYYLDPHVFTYAPLTVPALMEFHDVYSVDGAPVEEHLDLLCQMLDTPAVPVDDPNEVHLNARVYYALCGEGGETLFEVAMWGVEEADAIFINGVPCTADPIFYIAAMAFLPPDASAEFAGFAGIQGDG